MGATCCKSEEDKGAEAISGGVDAKPVIDSEAALAPTPAPEAPVVAEQPAQTVDEPKGTAEAADATAAPVEEKKLPVPTEAAQALGPTPDAPAPKPKKNEEVKKKKRPDQSAEKHKETTKKEDPNDDKANKDEAAAKPKKDSGKGKTKPSTSDLRHELKVVIIKARGLRDADPMLGAGSSDSYCVCEIPGKADSKIKTQVIASQSPEWNYEGQIADFAQGDSLKFTVCDRDFGKSDDLLGDVVLARKQIFPGGFDGELKLKHASDSAVGVDAYLQVKVAIARSYAIGASAPAEAKEATGTGAGNSGEAAKPEKGADKAKKPSKEETAPEASAAATGEDKDKQLLEAAETGDSKKMKQLLKDGASLDITNDKGMTALHLATAGGFEDVVGRLMLQKTKKKIIDSKVPDSKDTALHMACRDGKRDIAVMLVREGANLKAKNKEGKTPSDLAKGPLQSWMRGENPAGTNPPWMK